MIIIVLLSLFFIVILIAKKDSKSHKNLSPLYYRTNSENLEKAIRYTANLINSSEDEIAILSGSLKNELHKHLQTKDAYIQASKRDVHLSLITSKNEIKELKENEEELYNAFSSIKSINEEDLKKINHFMIFDGKHIRIEERHGVSNPDKLWTAHYFYNNRKIAKKELEVFKRLSSL